MKKEFNNRMQISEKNRQKLIEASYRLAKLKENRIKESSQSVVRLPKSAEQDIACAISSLPDDQKFDVNSICFKIVDMNYERFVGVDGSEDGFDYQMKRKRFATTSQIHDSIAVYLYNHAV